MEGESDGFVVLYDQNSKIKTKFRVINNYKPKRKHQILHPLLSSDIAPELRNEEPEAKLSLPELPTAPAKTLPDLPGRKCSKPLPAIPLWQLSRRALRTYIQSI